MRNKIFKSSFLASMIVLAVSFLMIFNLLYNYFENFVFSELESEAKYIEYGILKGADNFLNGLNEDEKRITVISKDGDVLYDTKTDADLLENHLEREEIAGALKNGTGKSERFSKTLMEKTLYYAIQMENGDILRLSVTQNSIFVILLGFMHPTVWIIVTALAVSVFLSYKVSKSITKPINQIDLDNPTANDSYEELSPLLEKLAYQKKAIGRQIKEAEKSREEFRLICENMSEGFLVVDKEGRVLSYNTAALNMLNIKDGIAADAEDKNTNEEKSEKEVKDANVFDLNVPPTFADTVKQALTGIHDEVCLSTDEVTYNLIANPVKRQDKTIGAVIVIMDITEETKREQLRREFTSNVSHELKTPLTSISGFAEMMKEGGMPDGVVKDFSNSIYQEAQRLISLVSDIIKISELDEGIALEYNEKVNLYHLAMDIADRLKSYGDRHNVKINVAGSDQYVWGNRKILDEMICNLCDNAIKYNKADGSVDILVSRNNKNVSLAVKDTGIGIPQGEQARVFERFYRVDKSRAKTVGGTGLGLAIVKHGALYHNAKICLESSEGVGTTIALVFESLDE